ncbi:alpha/beta hydrolase [Tsukamurella sp. PLM1]|uniref:alpha/beta hydrolase n=1 Tax=Tsukamurella sp. PLM1 TaxID=2929795 RepID=UPI00205C428F|nr:alpha/beta hydrolase [Tsukamurella sp. PLM1]BDH55739.1 hypothetical protein MTP03_06780 [Tsukamurella sp. PLM1]
MTAVTFDNNGITMAGELNLPDGFDAARTYPALVVVHPGGGVKEQTAGLYAGKLAEEGFVTLAYDASYQGESGGEPHFLEDPAARVADISAAVDYLQSLDYVDAERIGAWGVCAGGGYAVAATKVDARIKAVGTVSAVNIGSAWRKGWDGSGQDSDAVATRDGASGRRTVEATTGGDAATLPYVPAEITPEVPRDMAEASDYYLTPRAQHPNAQNKYLFAQSIPRILGFDAFVLVEDLLTQPVLIVAGSEAGSLWHSTELHARARSEKKLVIVDGAAHMDFYDGPEYVKRAVAEAAPFFAEKLASA